MLARLVVTPSPRRGEGWGEGAVLAEFPRCQHSTLTSNAVIAIPYTHRAEFADEAVEFAAARQRRNFFGCGRPQVEKFVEGDVIDGRTIAECVQLGVERRHADLLGNEIFVAIAGRVERLPQFFIALAAQQ